MIWLAFTIAFFSVCLGYAVSVLVNRRSNREIDQEETTEEPSAGPQPPIDPNQAREFLEQLQGLATTVDGEVGRHSTRVTEISGGLSRMSGDDPRKVLAAAAQLLEANKQLQNDLTFAQAEIQVQRQQLDSYMHEARTDTLTGLGNRRAFNEELGRRFGQLQRHQIPLSLMLIDIDHFKSFNDKYGHQAGDGMLQGVAQALTRSVREIDVVTRYGGEEFAVILPGTTLKEAAPAAERLRIAVADQHFHFRSVPLQVTVSVGLAEGLAAEGPEPLIQRADQALYAAKDAGRDSSYLCDDETCRKIEAEPPPIPDGEPPGTIRIAPYVDGRFLEWGMFREVECDELWSGGFSFRTSREPDYEQVVLAERDDSERAFRNASVEEWTHIGTEAEPEFRVRCRFVAGSPGKPANPPSSSPVPATGGSQ